MKTGNDLKLPKNSIAVLFNNSIPQWLIQKHQIFVTSILTDKLQLDWSVGQDYEPKFYQLSLLENMRSMTATKSGKNRQK